MEPPTLDGVPPELRAALAAGRLVPVTVGRSGSVVARVERDPGTDLFVKLVERGTEAPSLAPEAERLEWLSGRVPVPEVVLHGGDERSEWLVTTAVEGADASRTDLGIDVEASVRLFGEALRSFHDALDARRCPFSARTDDLVDIAARRVASGVVDPAEFAPIHRGVSAEELLGHVRDMQPDDPADLVVTHGDYCMPNVVLSGNGISGYVDVGLVGVSDPYRDLGIGARSVARNVGGHALGLFFEAYGIEWPDLARVDYFVMLDELF